MDGHIKQQRWKDERINDKTIWTMWVDGWIHVNTAGMDR